MASDSRIVRSIFLQWLLAWAFPLLRQWPVGEWPYLLSRARKVEFDRLEQVCTLAAVIVIAYQVRPMSVMDNASFIGYLTQYAFLVPLLALLLAPFYIRRIRRGLKLAANDRQNALCPDQFTGNK